MLVDVFIMLGIMAFIVLVLAYWRESVAIAALSLLFWIFLFAQSMNIEIPYHDAVDIGSGMVNVTTGAYTYSEPGLQAIILGVIFFNIIMLIIYFMTYKQLSKW